MPQMTDDDKTLPIDLSFGNIDLPKQEDLGDADSKEKALIPFDPLQRYLAEIRRFPLLSREEEHKLAVEFKEFGNIEAAYRLVTGNLRLVVMIAREYQKALKSLLDLIQEGNRSEERRVGKECRSRWSTNH